MDRYADEIKIISKPGGVKILVFKDSEYSAVYKAWKESKKDPEEEEIKILKVAASIIRNDSILCTTIKNFYPPSNAMIDNIATEISPKLNFLLQEIIVKNKRYNLENYDRKIKVIF